MPPVKRKQCWKEKRVFFLTPQVLQNDLSRGSCCAKDVVCLVFDEAHKALGNHSYCQVCISSVHTITFNVQPITIFINMFSGCTRGFWFHSEFSCFGIECYTW